MTRPSRKRPCPAKNSTAKVLQGAPRLHFIDSSICNLPRSCASARRAKKHGKNKGSPTDDRPTTDDPTDDRRRPKTRHRESFPTCPFPGFQGALREIRNVKACCTAPSLNPNKTTQKNNASPKRPQVFLPGLLKVRVRLAGGALTPPSVFQATPV